MRAIYRARSAGVLIADVSAAEIWVRDDGMCRICGLLADLDDWNLDHIIPLSAGGPHEPGNVQVTHPRCNRLKGDKVGWRIYAAEPDQKKVLKVP